MKEQQLASFVTGAVTFIANVAVGLIVAPVFAWLWNVSMAEAFHAPELSFRSGAGLLFGSRLFAAFFRGTVTNNLPGRPKP